MENYNSEHLTYYNLRSKVIDKERLLDYFYNGDATKRRSGTTTYNIHTLLQLVEMGVDVVFYVSMERDTRRFYQKEVLKYARQENLSIDFIDNFKIKIQNTIVRFVLKRNYAEYKRGIKELYVIWDD